MAIGQLRAVRFEGVMDEGRTHPILLACRSADTTQASETMLVKAIGCPEIRSTWQLVTELVGNAVACQMGVNTPTPAIIEIGDKMSGRINSSLWKLGYDFQVAAGLAAGCAYRSDLKPLTVGQPLSSELQNQAAKLFAFDMLSQNPDRRREKVNCGLTKNGLLAFDFELCFAHRFLPIVGGASGNAWQPSNSGVAKNHLFYTELRARPPERQLVRDMALALTPEWWSELRNNLPSAWQAEADKIAVDLLATHDNADDFSEDVCFRCLQ